ncbi:unnamed protein product [Rotaria magnacalcarata]|uniref:Uncharacterized protein n=1 Tax=Rotaria magnacalcarata TaxID=392030 RepID=A0A816SRV3_9BILA|nr:unnamed protein product [Rotaria magnacalcarata]CAF4040912.1 unnamed protein product [Rotaria magnacalcarata]CAF4081264.1 unnamed protein product [Rotaria magnacalcarata]CAF4084888.1 unnamed protein product [Rotaria magnacalcarata]
MKHRNIDKSNLDKWLYDAHLERREKRLQKIVERRQKLKELEQAAGDISLINFEKEVLENDEEIKKKALTIAIIRCR